MKTLFSKYLLIIFLIPIGFGCSRNNKNQPIDKVDYDGFVILSDSLSKYRETRLIDETTFNDFRSDANTIVLDTRSKEAYDEIHIEEKLFRVKRLEFLYTVTTILTVKFLHYMINLYV